MTNLFRNLITLIAIFYCYFDVASQTIYDISSDTTAVDELMYERNISFYVSEIDSFDVVFEHYMIESEDTIPLFNNDFNLIDQDFGGFKKVNFNSETNFFEFTLGDFNHLQYLTLLKLKQNGVTLEEYVLE